MGAFQGAYNHYLQKLVNNHVYNDQQIQNINMPSFITTLKNV
jgi:hypothetical protein